MKVIFLKFILAKFPYLFCDLDLKTQNKSLNKNGLGYNYLEKQKSNKHVN
jgi:hypothetical protein